MNKETSSSCVYADPVSDFSKLNLIFEFRPLPPIKLVFKGHKKLSSRSKISISISLSHNKIPLF